MRKSIIIAILCAFAALAVQAKGKTIVWENPTTEYGNIYGDGFFRIAVDVDKVELKTDETVVHLTAMERSDYPDFKFRFASDTYLKVGDTRYALVSADGIKLDEWVQTDKDYRLKMAFHFKPLPLNTKSFDFIEGDGDGAFQIKGIKSVEERWKQIFPSYWRDEKTGDWAIAFMDECAVYQCKFWDYKQRNVNPKTGEADFILTNGNQEIKVIVGKDQKGRRAMQIDGKSVVYQMITSRFLPDYPNKDTRTDFVNTGYKTDTITVVGWIKDIPQWMNMKTFDFSYNNFITDDQESVYADLDALGRFTVKIPILNSSEFFCDWNQCFVRTMLEPGKTYFMLYDFKEGRRMFMGDDCRLQNELYKHPLGWAMLRMEDGDDVHKYIASVDSILVAHNASIDNLCKAHPTLSARFAKFKKDNILWQYARNVGQARFDCPDFKLPEDVRQYAYDTFWSKMEHPYTLHRDIRGFIRDYVDDAKGRKSMSFNISDHIDEIEWTDDEAATLNQYKKWIADYEPRIQAATTTEEKRRIWQADSVKNAELHDKIQKLYNSPKVHKLTNEYFLYESMKQAKHVLDSLNVEPIIHDILISKEVYNQIDWQRSPIDQKYIDTLKSWVNNPTFVDRVVNLNDRYIAIANRDFDRLVLKSSDNLQGISEGKALLDKIIEPYRGKFVLLDIWGTWCGPCKEALSHSTEEYSRLSDFDIEYLYLANNSPQDSWENVIKEYNVSGDNVAHYNLPDDQQAAIERYLDVRSWPTYKLFDRDGNLLDVEVNPRDLEGTARLLEQLNR
jgi:thiol-disulfide isomerase/thioredoxin